MLSNILRRGIEVVNICPICGLNDETAEHVLFYCHYADQVRSEFGSIDLSFYLMDYQGSSFGLSWLVFGRIWVFEIGLIISVG